MKKFFVVFLFVFLGTFSWSQDVGYNYLPFDEREDTVQVCFGMRFGRVLLTQPKVPQGIAAHQKRAYEEFPEKVGVGNFILDMRTRFFRNETSAHDGVLLFNLSLLRTRAYLGYQYNRRTWYTSLRFGYEVYRESGGPVRAHTKSFSENLPLVSGEFGLLPEFWNQTFRFRCVSEYDFRGIGWYGSGIVTGKVFARDANRAELGLSFDGIFGYGLFGSFLWNGNLVYVSTFEGQLPFQEIRFPEQRIGMERGFAFGFQKSFE